MDTLGKFNFRTVIWLQKQFNFNKTDNFGQHIYFYLMNLVNWYVTRRELVGTAFLDNVIIIFTAEARMDDCRRVQNSTQFS